jgi:hypothetical protein
MSYLDKLENIIAKQRESKDRQPEALQTNLDHILQLRLSDLAKRNMAIKIYAEVLDCEVWLCSNAEMAGQVKLDDPEAITYTVKELRSLYRLKPSPEDLRALHNTKAVFPGSKIVNSKLKELSNESADAQDH